MMAARPATAVGVAEQPCVAAKGCPTQRAIGGVVGDADTAIVEKPGERGSRPQHVVDLLCEIVVA